VGGENLLATFLSREGEIFPLLSSGEGGEEFTSACFITEFGRGDPFA